MMETMENLVNPVQEVSLAMMEILVLQALLVLQVQEERREKRVREVLLERPDLLDPLDLQEKALVLILLLLPQCLDKATPRAPIR
jgi:hypothetical protein